MLEFKSAGLKNASLRIKEGAKKADRVLLKLNDALSDSQLQQFVARQWAMKDRLNMQELIIYINNDLKVFKRP